MSVSTGCRVHREPVWMLCLSSPLGQSHSPGELAASWCHLRQHLCAVGWYNFCLEQHLGTSFSSPKQACFPGMSLQLLPDVPFWLQQCQLASQGQWQSHRDPSAGQSAGNWIYQFIVNTCSFWSDLSWWILLQADPAALARMLPPAERRQQPLDNTFIGTTACKGNVLLQSEQRRWRVSAWFPSPGPCYSLACVSS